MQLPNPDEKNQPVLIIKEPESKPAASNGTAKQIRAASKSPAREVKKPTTAVGPAKGKANLTTQGKQKQDPDVEVIAHKHPAKKTPTATQESPPAPKVQSVITIPDSETPGVFNPSAAPPKEVLPKGDTKDRTSNVGSTKRAKVSRDKKKRTKSKKNKVKKAKESRKRK